MFSTLAHGKRKREPLRGNSARMPSLSNTTKLRGPGDRSINKNRNFGLNSEYRSIILYPGDQRIYNQWKSDQRKIYGPMWGDFVNVITDTKYTIKKRAPILPILDPQRADESTSDFKSRKKVHDTICSTILSSCTKLDLEDEDKFRKAFSHVLTTVSIESEGRIKGDPRFVKAESESDTRTLFDIIKDTHTTSLTSNERVRTAESLIPFFNFETDVKRTSYPDAANDFQLASSTAQEALLRVTKDAKNEDGQPLYTQQELETFRKGLDTAFDHIKTAFFLRGTRGANGWIEHVSNNKALYPPSVEAAVQSLRDWNDNHQVSDNPDHTRNRALKAIRNDNNWKKPKKEQVLYEKACDICGRHNHLLKNSFYNPNSWNYQGTGYNTSYKPTVSSQDTKQQSNSYKMKIASD